MLYAEQLASYGTGETFPHAAAEGFIKIASLEVELGSRPRAGHDHRHDASGPARVAAARSIRPSRRFCAPTTPSCSRTTARRRRSTHAGCTRPGSSTTASWPRPRRGSRRSPRAAGSSPRTRTSTRRSSACSATSAARSTPAAPATTRSRRRSGSTSPTPCAEARAGIAALRRRRARPRRGRGRHADARLHAPPARPAGDASAITCCAWVEMLERDLARFAAAAAAAAPSPLGAGALAGLDAAAAAARAASSGTRSTRSPTATSRSTTSTPPSVCFVHLSRIGEELVLWTTAEFGFAAPRRGRRDRLVDDAAEAEPGRRRARARQGRDGDRAADRAARDREGPAARLQPRPAGGQAARLRAPAPTSPARSRR